MKIARTTLKYSTMFRKRARSQVLSAANLSTDLNTASEPTEPKRRKTGAAAVEISYEKEGSELEDKAEGPSPLPATPTKAKAPLISPPGSGRKTPIKAPLAKREPPENWEKTWDIIATYRASHPAPVDTVGCERLADRSDPKSFRFQTLVALMLSSQTKDPVTAQAMTNVSRSLWGSSLRSTHLHSEIISFELV